VKPVTTRDPTVGADDAVDGLLRPARAAWRAGVERDERDVRHASEQRLLRALRARDPRAGERGRGAWIAGACLAGCVIAGILLRPPTAREEIRPDAPAVSAAPRPGPSTEPVAAPAAEAPRGAPAEVDPVAAPAPVDAPAPKAARPAGPPASVLPPLPPLPPPSPVTASDPWARPAGSGAHPGQGDPWGAPAGAKRRAFRVDRDALDQAERELGGGEIANARARLHVIVHNGEPAVAVDAAAILARSYKDPHRELAVWEEVLRRQLPEPQRARAARERARLLVAIGRVPAPKD
jgi:hypothetical protein